MTLNLLSNDTSSLNTDADVDLNVEKASNLPLSSDNDSAETETLRPQFWSRFKLSELNHSEWEALCDGCGSCCLIKYIDEDEDGNVDESLVEYTDVTCQLMDCATGYCGHYATRQEHVPDCIQLTIKNCGYRRTVLISACIKVKAYRVGIYY